MKRIIIIVISLIQTTAVSAQEYNIGLHINPTLSVPVMGTASSHNTKIKVSPLRVCYNIGVDINIQYNKWRIETGFNVMNKAVSFYQRTLNLGGIAAYSKDVVNSTSFEVPVLLGYKILTRNKNTFYHLYGLAGVSYENNYITGTSSVIGTQGDGTSTNIVKQDIVTPSNSYQWINVIAGFHINAIIRSVGLIDYGISYHYPLTASGAHDVTTSVNTGSGQIEYKGTFYPHMSYINFKLCYYFLNLDNSLKRKKYHKL